MRTIVICLCCALVMKLLLIELGTWWTNSCASTQGVGRRDQMGCGSYLDSFGPNGVVFPRSSCNMEGHLPRGTGIKDVMKSELRGIVLVPKCNTYGSAAVGIHRQSCRQWNPNIGLHVQVKDISAHTKSHMQTHLEPVWWGSAPSICPITFINPVSYHPPSTSSTTPSLAHILSHTHNNKMFCQSKRYGPSPAFLSSGISGFSLVTWGKILQHPPQVQWPPKNQHLMNDSEGSD